MPEAPEHGLEQELQQAFDGLHEALGRATEATAALSALAARVRAISSVFDQIEAAVQEGRSQLAGASAAIHEGQVARAPITRPTLVVPAAPVAPEPVAAPAPVPFATPAWDEAAAQASAPEPLPQQEPAPEPETAAAPEPEALPEPVATAPVPQISPERHEELVSFRLEFESRPGALDLRAVDDAISEHPAVRDIALLDYDGHRATLKVWVSGGTSPLEVQQTLRDQVLQRFPGGNDVTVIALEDAA